MFLTIGLPSLLAQGNLPSLRNLKESIFYIYTQKLDDATLRAAPSFKRLSALMPTEVILVETDKEAPHRTMSDCHIDTMRKADEAGVAAVFVPPDCVWSNGSFTRLEALALAGKSVVHISGVRTHRDELVPHLKKHLSNDDQVLTIEAQPLVDLGLKHLHPIATSHFWNEREGGLMPANLYWTVPGEGLALRCFHLHPLLVKSQIPFASFASTIDDDLALAACPDVSRDYIVGDSDEILCFEMSGLDRIIGTVCAKNSIDGVAGWAEFGTNRRHRELGRFPIRLHSKPMTETLWRPIEAEGGRVIDRIVRLNGLPTHVLATEAPTVLAGRIYAVSLGRGEYAERDIKLAKQIVATKDKLLAVNRKVRSTVFFNKGEARITHPMWLIRQSTLAALLDCVGPGDRNVVLLGADAAFGHHLERALPAVKVRVASVPTNTDPASVRGSDGGDADLAIVVDFAGRAAVPPLGLTAVAGAARRTVWLRMGQPGNGSTAAAPCGVDVRWFGGPGTLACRSLWFAGRRLTAGKRTNALSLRWLPLKAVALVTLPVAYVAAAAAGASLNAAGLAFDKARARQGIGGGTSGSGVTAIPPVAATSTSAASPERNA